MNANCSSDPLAAAATISSFCTDLKACYEARENVSSITVECEALERSISELQTQISRKVAEREDWEGKIRELSSRLSSSLPDVISGQSELIALTHHLLSSDLRSKPWAAKLPEPDSAGQDSDTSMAGSSGDFDVVSVDLVSVDCASVTAVADSEEGRGTPAHLNEVTIATEPIVNTTSPLYFIDRIGGRTSELEALAEQPLLTTDGGLLSPTEAQNPFENSPEVHRERSPPEDGEIREVEATKPRSCPFNAAGSEATSCEMNALHRDWSTGGDAIKAFSAAVNEIKEPRRARSPSSDSCRTNSTYRSQSPGCRSQSPPRRESNGRGRLPSGRRKQPTRRFCWDWNRDGTCPRYWCPFVHRCEMCDGSHISRDCWHTEASRRR